MVACKQQPSIKEILIGPISSKMSYQLRNIYNVLHVQVQLQCCYVWKVHNGN